VAANLSICAVNLETPPPVIGAAEFAEERHSTTRFPKDEAQRKRYQFLVPLMLASRDHQTHRKKDLMADCKRKFDVTIESFRTCWREAIRATGARWAKPGRRPRKKNESG